MKYALIIIIFIANNIVHAFKYNIWIAPFLYFEGKTVDLTKPQEGEEEEEEGILGSAHIIDYLINFFLA